MIGVGFKLMILGCGCMWGKNKVKKIIVVIWLVIAWDFSIDREPNNHMVKKVNKMSNAS